MFSFPTTSYEKMLRAAGCVAIAGVDEVGRGSWAGPLIACAVVLPPKPRIYRVQDSKKLSPKKRATLAARIKDCAVSWALGVVTHTEIDSLGLSHANELAMMRAIAKLRPTPDHVLIDTFTLFSLPMKHTAIPHGDAVVYSIAAASIVAKEARDAMMCEFDVEFPVYGFVHHKGYGTRDHEAMLRRYGPCAIHRRSFQPVQQVIEYTYGHSVPRGTTT